MTTVTSSPTKSTSSIIERSGPQPLSVVIAFGSNLGPRRYQLLRALTEVGKVVRLVCVSEIVESDAIDAPPGAPPFLNMVAVASSTLPKAELMAHLLRIERALGRVRGVRNASRTIDLDLILCSAERQRSAKLTVPHPRAHRRSFVMEPLRQCSPALASAVLRAAS
jgi:2-amino-4-hydroxy-6-hydroxymethyldihydropteridine diphosphokinase